MTVRTITQLGQLYRNGPEKSPCGDCYRTALACLLGLPDPRLVPHFVDMAISMYGRDAYRLEDMWVREWLRQFDIDFATCDLAEITALGAEHDVALYGLVTIPGHVSPAHAVVWDVAGARVHWDPTTLSGYDLEAEVVEDGEIQVAVTPYDPGPETMVYRPWEGAPATEVFPLLTPWAIINPAQLMRAKYPKEQP